MSYNALGLGAARGELMEVVVVLVVVMPVWVSILPQSVWYKKDGLQHGKARTVRSIDRQTIENLSQIL